MKDKIKEISNKELIQLYRLILEHIEVLKNEEEKVKEEDAK